MAATYLAEGKGLLQGIRVFLPSVIFDMVG
jgi:hypothetical protein